MENKKKLIFAFVSSSLSPEAFIHAESIRKFGGKLANSPIWILVPKKLEEIPIEKKDRLDNLNVEVISFEANQDILDFPLAVEPLAASTVERMAENKTEVLAFLGLNSIILNEPKLFILEEGINLRYRPVHHTLIGSIYEEELDSFWKIIYDKCQVPKDKIFPMKTHVDGNTIKPYFNAGCLIVRP
ncbi:MAG: hypothetical protein ACXABK_07430, partial [Candidatus Heimdallarchaeaceae archaeon]